MLYMILQILCVHRAEKGYKHDCLSVSSYTHIRKLNYKHSPRFISGEVRKRTQKIWISNDPTGTTSMTPYELFACISAAGTNFHFVR